MAKTLLVLLVAVLNVVRAAPAPILGIPAPYGLEELSWSVKVFDDQQPHVLNGTVEQVLEQILQVNPNYQINRSVPSKLYKLEARSGSRSSGSRRLPAYVTSGHCANYPKGPCNSIEAGIQHLRFVEGKPLNGPGPGNCGRVSCSDGAGIFWCNDNMTPKELPSFRKIADVVWGVRAKCGCVNEEGFSGQAFCQEGWNVIARGADC